jgi:hypothetical protein
MAAPSPLEAFLVEQARVLARELEAVTRAAPAGHVLAHAELAAVRLGREFTRRALEATLQLQTADAEKKGPPLGPVPAASAATPKERPAKRP